MHIEARFYETYELCAIVDGILKDQSGHIVKLEGFHCDEQWAKWVGPYKRYSAFHQFIEFIVREVHGEQADAVDIAERKNLFVAYARIPGAIEGMKPNKLPIEIAFDHHSIRYQSFLVHLSETGCDFQDADEDDVYEFMNEVWLSESYEKLLDQTVAEVFHVLFQNRRLLLTFNDYVAGVLSRVNLADAESSIREQFSTGGTLKRARPPTWARRAVFFRDRGRCVLCDKDLSGLMNLANVENYDHVVPLVLFGFNDISNLQLLCIKCNQLDKKGGAAITSGRYQLALALSLSSAVSGSRIGSSCTSELTR